MPIFRIEEKWAGIYYISKEGHIKTQIVVTKELSRENHIWLNSLSASMNELSVAELVYTTKALKRWDEKIQADSLWEVVATVNKEMVEKVMEDEKVCKALAEIMKPEIDEAFDNGFNNGLVESKIVVFRNMIKDGMPREQAQRYAEISDQIAEQVLAEM